MFSGTKARLVFVGLLFVFLLVMPTVAWALSVETASLPSASRQVYYSESLDASGGDGSYTWSLYSGNLPPGLELYVEGIIEGIPTSAGSYSFTVRVRDGNNDSATKTVTLRVLTASGPVISTTSLPAASLGVSYRTTFAASGGNTPYTWSVESGSLPSGLSLSNAGTISGTPTSTGTYSFTLRVRDNQGRLNYRSFSISVESLFITTEELPDAARRGLYNEPLYAAGGAGSYTWSLYSGRLPSGMTVTSNGNLTGVPTSSGSSSFTLRVRDGSNQTATKSFTLRVEDRGSIIINTDTNDLPFLIWGKPVLFALEADGGDPPYSWSLLRGALPDGMRLHNNGTISGTPQGRGKSSFTVQVFDQSGLFSNKLLSLDVGETAPEELPAGDGSLSIYIDGQRLLTDTAPFMEEGRTFVPLRGVFEKLNAQVIWDDALRQVTIRKQAVKITMQAGNKEAQLNGRIVMLDAAPQMLNGRLMVPLRFVGEALGVQVHWDNNTQQVNIGS